MRYYNALYWAITILCFYLPLLLWPYRLTKEDKAKIRALYRTKPRIIPSALEIPLAFGLFVLASIVGYSWLGFCLGESTFILLWLRVRRRWWEVEQINPKRIWPPMYVYRNFGMRVKKKE